ncbi:MAG: Do family serine endopeptidase [Alphaproteobacteria bacterium]|nr:Do family serine endopeptidase [Alphaproteobacteria bacterium]
MGSLLRALCVNNFKNSRTLRIATALCVATTFCAVGNMALAQSYSRSDEKRTVPESQAQVQLSFAPVVKKVAPAVVNIYTSRKVQLQNPFMNDPLFRHFFSGLGLTMGERTENSLGSGVIIGPDGLIVTSNHVIQGAQEVKIVLNDRREFDAKIILNDKKSDLALVRIEAQGAAFPYLPLRDADMLEVGDLVLAVGNPFGVGQTVTSGIVSGLARTTVGVSDFQFFIQTDAAINPGNSGGALVDMEGNLVGVNTAIYSTSGASNGIGFAIPSNMVQTVMASGVSGNKHVIRPWLGIDVQPVTREMAEALGLEKPQGVIINDVADYSPARRAGLRPKDVILTIEGNDILDEQGMRFRTGTSKIGETVKFGIFRRGRMEEAKVDMVAPPETPPRDVRILRGAHPFNGLRVANLSPALANELDLNMIEKGVVVIGDSGNRFLKPKDIIIQVESEEINSTQELERILARPRQSWQIAFKRGKQVLGFTIR